MWKNYLFISSIIILLLTCFINIDYFSDFLLPTFPEIESNKIWNDKDVVESDEIRPIGIKVPDVLLKTLNEKILTRNLPPSMPDSAFRYGFNADYLKNLLSYWREKYVWNEWENKINSFPNFFATINGLQIHFIHIKPKLKPGQRSVPLLLLHGWPGSFFEFYKVIPLLVDTPESENFAFEIVCPSLPGFGWSDGATKPGLGISAVSRVFFNLMERLNITEQFYVQGGDFGSFIAATMSKLNPRKLAGIHINMALLPMEDLRFLIKVGVGAMLPSKFHFMSEEDQNMIYPLQKKMETLMNQFGYFWLQSTRPNTIGIALSDNPVGLAAYILEKFGAWSNDLHHHMNSTHGGLEDMLISKDEMLTNVMIYYITNSISSSMRFYKEMWNEQDHNIMKHPVKVPVGIALFPNEIIKCPKYLAQLYYRDIRQYSIMPRGGHFAALEEPGLLAEDLKSFINKVEDH